MGQKNSILYANGHETIKVQTNAHAHTPYLNKNLTLKITLIFFKRFMKTIGES